MAYGMYIYICVYKFEIMGILKQQASPFSVCFLIVKGLYIYIYIYKHVHQMWLTIDHLSY